MTVARSGLPRSTTLTEEGRKVRRGLVGLAAALAGVVLLVLVAAVFDRSTVVPGPPGSSYVTTPMGTAALFEVLEELGRRPRRLRAPVTDEALAGASAYLVLDPGLSSYADPETAALRRFAEEGGTVLVAGLPPAPLASALLEEVPRWSAGTVAEAVPPESLDGVRRVVAGRFGAFDTTGSAAPLLAAGDRSLALEADVVDGRVVLVADMAVFSNQNLDEADNAELAVALAGPGPVVFDELRHGHGQTGPGGILGALPGDWDRVALLLLAVTPLALAVYGRRLGPPEPARRDLPPERRLFVESVARTLLRTRDHWGATAPTRRSALRLLADRVGLGPDPSPEAVRRAAADLGLPPGEVEVLVAEAAGADVAGGGAAVAADRALARLSAPPGGGVSEASRTGEAP